MGAILGPRPKLAAGLKSADEHRTAYRQFSCFLASAAGDIDTLLGDVANRLDRLFIECEPDQKADLTVIAALVSICRQHSQQMMGGVGEMDAEVDALIATLDGKAKPGLKAVPTLAARSRAQA